MVKLLKRASQSFDLWLQHWLQSLWEWGGGSRRMPIYYGKVSTHAHRIIQTPLLKILDPPLVKSIFWGVKWFSYPLSKVKRKTCVYNDCTGPLDMTGLLDRPLDSKQHTKWWGISRRCIYLVYESFQQLIDLSSMTEINQFRQIQHFGLNTKAIIRDNTRQIRSECMLLKY